MERIGGWVGAEGDKSTENHFKVKTLKQLNIRALVPSLCNLCLNNIRSKSKSHQGWPVTFLHGFGSACRWLLVAGYW
jgi:hypothetical protein